MGRRCGPISRPALFLLLLAGFRRGRAQNSSQADPCSGRGHMGDGGKCVCDNPLPSKGSFGFAGTHCDMPVFGSAADGRDMTEACRSNGCNSLAPETWMCFTAPFPWNSTAHPWKHLTVQLARTSANDAGDPDLYGMFYGGQAGKAKALGKATFGYDFKETSSSSHAVVVKRVRKASFSPPTQDYQGAYLCVKAYGAANVTFSLRASVTMCPADFNATGHPMLCSSPVGGPPATQRFTGCSAEGECQCAAPYAKPVQQVYNQLGFEDCSASVTRISARKLAIGTPYMARHQRLPPKAWAFFAFNTTAADFQVVASVASERDAHCTDLGYFGLYAKFGQPPGWRYGQWDFRPRWDMYAGRSQSLEVAFDMRQHGWQTGEWYIGVSGDDVHTCNFTLALSKYKCPLDCSGRGTCQTLDSGNRTCLCQKGYFGEACASEAAALAFGGAVVAPERAFEYDFFQLPELTPAMLTHSVEVSIAASFSSGGYGQWAAARPELLLLKGDHMSQPTTANYTFKQVMAKQNTTYEINLCPSQLKEGVWRAAVFNPMRIYKLAYNVSAAKRAHCLNDCNGHGACSADGLCECAENWTGGDCSVNLAGGCPAGSRQPARRVDAHGTCWHECVCDAGNTCTFNLGVCAEFSCEAGFRRRGNAEECVRDACTQAEWVEEEGYACLKGCVCPTDGGACTLSGSCAAEHFACKAGFVRAADGAPQCFPVGCTNGTWQVAPEVEVEGGVAYAPCVCRGEERPGQPLCRHIADAPKRLALACAEGYVLQGATGDGGAGPPRGGACVRAGRRPGTPAFAVALWSLLSLAIGAGVGVGLFWWHEHRSRKWGTQELYHELSMDTGF